jgi:hypothetical protein
MLLVSSAMALGTSSACAGSLTEGSVLPNYAIVSVGPNSSIMVNSGPVAGNVLLGDGNTSSSSGGGNGQVTGVVNVSPPASGDFLAHIQIPPSIVTVASTVGTQAFADAQSLSTTASGLAPTQSYTTAPPTINGNGGLNVINVTNINGALTLHGGPHDVFVFNVSGTFNSNQPMTLTGGVTASHILFNLTGTSGNIFQTAGGDVLFGTFLATDGGDFQFSNLDLTGQLINTGGHIQLVSGSKIPTFAPFTAVPEPSTIALAMCAMGGSLVAGVRSRLRRSKS